LLSLAKPLRFAYGTIEALELGLGDLSFPLDLSGGAARFRTRRTRVRSARVIVDIPELVPDRLIALSPIANGMAWALTDAFGRLADVVQSLSNGDRDGARRAWERVRERLPELPEALLREAQALAVDPSVDRDHPIGITLALRAALRAGDAIAASSSARALADVEPCGAVAGEGLCGAAALAGPGGPA